MGFVSIQKLFRATEVLFARGGCYISLDRALDEVSFKFCYVNFALHLCIKLRSWFKYVF